ncbi:MAG: YdcF family protein [Pseudomonadota bacterium]
MTSAMLMAVVRTLILPPVSLLIFFAAGRWIKVWHPRIGKIISNTSLILLLILSTCAGAWLLVTPLENLEKPLIATTQTGAQAIVVLSAGSLASNPEYDDKSIPDYIALGRIRYAAKLYRDTGLPILVTGGSGSKSLQNDSFAQGMTRVFEYEFAIPVKWHEELSTNTRENAIYSAQILKKDGVTHILLVTDAMHMRRAKLVFEQAGLRVTSAPTLFFSRDEIGLFSYLPSAEGLRRSHYAMYEWLGLAWHWMKA